MKRTYLKFIPNTCLMLLLAVLFLPGTSHASQKKPHYYRGTYKGTLYLTNVIDQSLPGYSCSAPDHIDVKFKLKELKTGAVTIKSKNPSGFVASYYGDSAIDFQTGYSSGSARVGDVVGLNHIGAKSADAVRYLEFDSGTLGGRCFYTYQGSLRRKQ